MSDQDPQQTVPTFAELVTAAEERADGLYFDLSELEGFARVQTQSNGDRSAAAALEALTTSRSFVYQTFRILRQLTGHLAGLGLGQKTVDKVGTSPDCCPAWGLAAGSFEWMTPPNEPGMRVQPSVLDSDGMLLPIIKCPFCGRDAPSRVEAKRLGISSTAEDDEVTAVVKVPVQ